MEKSANVQLIELRHGKVPIEKLIADRRAQRKSIRKIAKELGTTHAVIYRWGRYYGIDFARQEGQTAEAAS